MKKEKSADCNTPNPSLAFNARYDCGCMSTIENIQQAIEHVQEKKHTVTVTGSIIAHNKIEPTEYQGETANLKFTCGCGFTAALISKAIEHAKKTGHKVNAKGKVSPDRIES
jgi:hypothetical protein